MRCRALERGEFSFERSARGEGGVALLAHCVEVEGGGEFLFRVVRLADGGGALGFFFRDSAGATLSTIGVRRRADEARLQIVERGFSARAACERLIAFGLQRFDLREALPAVGVKAFDVDRRGLPSIGRTSELPASIASRQRRQNHPAQKPIRPASARNKRICEIRYMRGRSRYGLATAK